MRILRLVVVVSLFALVCAGAKADVYMKQANHTGEIKAMGHTQPAQDDTASIWLDKDKAAMVNAETKVIFRADKDSIYVIDDADKSYMPISLEAMKNMTEAAGTMQEEMAKAMKDLSDEDKAKMKETMEKLKDNPQMKAMAEKMMGGNMPSADAEASGEKKPFVTVKVTPTNETKTINGWDTKKYTATMEMAMGNGTSEIWAAQSLQVDPDLLNTLGMSMMAGRSGFEDLVKEMRKVDGVPVYSVHHTNMMGATVETTSTLLEFKDDAKAPAGMFDIPAGYTKKDMPSMSGMGH